MHHPKTGRDMSHLLYTQDHYGWVFETNAVDSAHTEKELFENVNNYLGDPSRKSGERRLLKEVLCYRVDGCSSERIVHAITRLSL